MGTACAGNRVDDTATIDYTEDKKVNLSENPADVDNAGRNVGRKQVTYTETRSTDGSGKTSVVITKKVVISGMPSNDGGNRAVVKRRILKNDVDEEGFTLMRSATGKDLPMFDGKFFDWDDDDDFLDHVPDGARAVGGHIPKVETHDVHFGDLVPKKTMSDHTRPSEVVHKPDIPEEPEFDSKPEVEADEEFKMMVDPAPTKDEMAFFLSLNKARTKPKYFANVIKEMLTHFDSRDNTFLFPNEKVKLMTHEGKKAFVEAIKFLKKQKPLPPFDLSTGMSLAARDLVADHGPRNMGGHVGSDRSTMDVRMNFYGTWSTTCGENCGYGRKLGEHMVAQLIADDGVPSRGHRNNVFNPAFQKVGIATGPHFSYGSMVVNDFAGDYYEDPREKQVKAHHDRLLYFFVHEDKEK